LGLAVGLVYEAEALLHLELVVVLCHLLVASQFVLSSDLVLLLPSVGSVCWVHLLLVSQVAFS
jgi:hypothetical protein